MRFDPPIHWNDGLFLQPHHLQRMQRNIYGEIHQTRSFVFAHPCGVIDLEYDRDALHNARLLIKRFSAVMPCGAALSMPGNCVISPLDLKKLEAEKREGVMVYLALPHWSEFEANLTDEDTLAKRQYSAHEFPVRDENSGGNEIPLIFRHYNARLVSDADNLADLELLPLMRLRPVTRETSEVVWESDSSYMPPFLVITADCPLFDSATELLLQIKRTCDKLLDNLSASGCKADTLSGSNLMNVLQLQTLNAFSARMSSLLVPGRISPFDLYVEMQTVLGQLSALHPQYGIDMVADYRHEDSMPCFWELYNGIRALIAAEGGVNYVQFKFEQVADGMFLEATLPKEQTLRGVDYYLAVSSEAEDRQVIRALESGDNFKLIDPDSRSARVRGVKLVEMRYPPRYLPALQNTLWFKLKLVESTRIWREICEKQAIDIDWAHDLFPQLEVRLFMTVQTDKRSGDPK